MPRELMFHPDWGAESPIWEEGAMVWLDQLPIPDDLAFRLGKWAERLEEIFGGESANADEQPWREEGRRLFDETRPQLAARDIDLVWDYD